ncbi:MAG: sialidase family protein [Candidatus Nanoarchaeia archaeon]|jgi:hypothetical protein
MRSGITPVVSVVLLLLITVAISSSAFIWVSGTQAGIQKEASLELSRNQDSISNFVNIIGISIDLSTREINVTLHNIGDKTITAGPSAISILDDNNIALETIITSLNNNLAQNELITLSVNYSYVLIENDTYNIRVNLPGGIVRTSPIVAGTRLLPNCSAGWGCYSISQRGYQDFDCSWSSVSTCPNGCSGGVCVNLCSGVTCSDYCSSAIAYFSGACSLGTCSYSSTNCSAGYCDGSTRYYGASCSGGSCVSYSSTNCSAPTCEGSTRKYNGYCTNDSCVYESEVCDIGCSGGECTSGFYSCSAGVPVVDFSGTTTFSLDDDLGCGCNVASSSNFLFNAGFESGDFTAWDYSDASIVSDAYAGSYSALIESEQSFSNNTVNNVDYISFYINSSTLDVSDSFAYVGVEWDNGDDDMSIIYLMYYTLDSFSCDLNMGTAYLRCVDGLTNDSWSLVELNPISDVYTYLGFNASSLNNFSLSIAVLSNQAWFDEFFINMSAEGHYCDSGNDNGLADGICFSGACSLADDSQVVCENGGDVWFTGTTTGTNSSCCGDDLSESFYNGTLSSTSYFCLDSLLINQSLDTNETVCAEWGFDWLSGSITGTSGACCGDDGSSEDFYNTTAYCCSGVLNTTCCGDGECQSWEYYDDCPSDCRWTQPVIMSADDDLISNNPFIVSGSDRLYLVWQDNSSGNYNIYFKSSTDYGATWSSSSQLTSAVSYSNNPSLAVNDSNLYLTWADNRDGEFKIYFKSSTDYGATWGVDTVISDGVWDSTPIVALSGDSVYVVYFNGTGVSAQGDLFFIDSSDGGSSWDSPARLTTSGNGYAGNQDVFALDDYVLVPYVGYYTYYWAIFVNSSDRGANWFAPRRLSGEFMAVTGSQASVFNNGNIFTFYDQFSDFFMTNSSDYGVTWSSVNLTDGNDYAVADSAIDNDKLYVTLQYHDGSDYEVYFTNSSDSGATWSNISALSNDAYDNLYSSIAVLDDYVFVVWVDSTTGTNEVYLMRYVK